MSKEQLQQKVGCVHGLQNNLAWDGPARPHLLHRLVQQPLVGSNLHQLHLHHRLDAEIPFPQNLGPI